MARISLYKPTIVSVICNSRCEKVIKWYTCEIRKYFLARFIKILLKDLREFSQNGRDFADHHLITNANIVISRFKNICFLTGFLSVLNNLYHAFSFFRQLIAPNNQSSRDLSFDVIEIQGGGSIEIQSDKDGLSITCSTLWIRSGGVLIADRLSVAAHTVTIEQSGVIDLNFKVRSDV